MVQNCGKYRFSGVEKKLSFGALPDESLAASRDARDEARRQLTNTIDPGILKNSIKRSRKPMKIAEGRPSSTSGL
ncbi:MAG: DUF4102 domain-containing protein [Tatlockia sp.]|nr:DUF4102 domain-containing protein [Tatlockia sp.]